MVERYPQRTRRPVELYGYIVDDESDICSDDNAEDQSDSEMDASMSSAVHSSHISSDEAASCDDDDATDGDATPRPTSPDEHVTSNSNFYKSRCGTIQWRITPPPSSQTRSVNVLRQRRSIPRHVRDKHLSSPADTFLHVFHGDLIEKVLIATNAKLTASNSNGSCVGLDEFYGFVGLLILAGAYHDNRLSIDELFHTERGRPINNATMSREWFSLILRHLRFDDHNTRTERRRVDKLAPIREVWELFVSRLRSSYNPGPNRTIDEVLTPFRGKCPFRRYIPSKPAKYGIKIWLCDSETFYPFNGQVYCVRQPNDHQREVGQSKRVVIDLTEPLFNSGRNICADNFFSSYDLLLELKQHNITYLGTMRKNKKEIPAEFTNPHGRLVHSSLFGHSEHATLVSYIPKKGKCVVLLSSSHFDNCVDSAPPYKPDMIADYNSQKCGVDVMDSMVAHFTTRRATKRWPVRLFMTMIDVGTLAGYVLYHTIFESISKNKRDRFRYLLSVSEELMRIAISSRNVSLSIPQSSRRVLDQMQYNVASTNSSTSARRSPNLKRGRCCICPHRSSASKHSRLCDQCKRFVCKLHSHETCLCDQCLDI